MRRQPGKVATYALARNVTVTRSERVARYTVAKPVRVASGRGSTTTFAVTIEAGERQPCSEKLVQHPGCPATVLL